MTSIFPSILTSYTNPNPTDRLNSPSHSGIETNQNLGVSQLENVIGVEGATSVVGSFQYLVKSPASNGGGHVQTPGTGGTGQTTYSKGDVLVAQSAAVISKLAITATDGLALVADSTQAVGIKWGVPNNKPNVRIFSVNGTTSSVFTWAKPANLSYIRVQVQAAGGGGGSILGNTKQGSAGAAGGWGVKILSASVLGATERVEVAAGGKVSSVTTGSTTFGITNAAASIIATPGDQGAQAGTTTTGGSVAGADFVINGGNSKSAGIIGALGYGGDGGDSQLGHGGKSGPGNGLFGSNPATGYGSGGPGGASDNVGGIIGASAGMPGIVIIEEY